MGIGERLDKIKYDVSNILLKSKYLKAEIDVTYGKAFVAGKKNGEETMQAEIDEAVWIINYLNDGGDPIADDCSRVIDFLNKHKGE